ncbi:MAG: polysaccharide biosynthesis/export family protein [Fidelibacterota bacterium]
MISKSNAQSSNQLDLSSQMDASQQPILYREYGVKPLPLEYAIDPEKYLLGPGDRLRINISLGIYEELISKEWSVENVDNFVTIGPSGKLIVPKLGPINVLGKTLAEIEREINEKIRLVYQSANISINLIRFRQFKVLVYGAVNKPKFVKMAPVSRLQQAIQDAGGVQKFAHPERVVLIRSGEKRDIYLKEFLLKGDLDNNPLLKDGDQIYVPFIDVSDEHQMDYTEYDIANKVQVTGFVYRPKAHYYRPGYNARDYIALSGGSLDIGSAKRTIITRKDGSREHFASRKNVNPGDIIEVPETYNSILFGNTGLIQAVTSVATLILAYQATQ